METKLINSSVEDGETRIKLDNLRTIIRNIAICQAEEIGKETELAPPNEREFKIVKFADEVILSKYFNGLDQALLDEQLRILEESVNNIMNLSILVKGEANKVNKLVPLSYEVLSLIFVSTDEKFRQFYFHELIEYYYHELCENIENLCPTKLVSREDFDQQVKVFLPIVKLESALKFIDNEDSERQIPLEEITSNITLFLKYPRLNQEDIYAIVNNKLGSKDYELISYETIAIHERNGHLGDYFKLKIYIKFENTEKVLNLFAKFLTPKVQQMKDLVCSGPSKKEEFFYTAYLPLLEKHGLKYLVDFCPRCYLSRLNDVLVLDDMVSLGFTALTPNIKLEYDGLMFVVKQIAKFHACSMIFEEMLCKQEGHKVSVDEVYAEYFKEVLLNPDDEFLRESWQKALKIIHYMVEKFSDLNKTFTHDEFIERIDAEWKLMFKKVSKSQKFKNTVVHGDMYLGNMLFKFDSTGTCRGATLVDFQIIRYCPAVQDILFFLYQNSFKETRDKHFRELIEGYYSELTKHLETFNLDIATIYPKDQFEESLDYLKPQGVFQALYYSPFNMLDPKLREEIIQDPELLEKYFSGETTDIIDLGLEDDNYRKVMGGLMADLVEFCENVYNMSYCSGVILAAFNFFMFPLFDGFAGYLRYW